MSILSGVFVSSWLGSLLLQVGEWIIKKLPLVKHIYSAAKQVSAAVNPANETTQSFRECVLIRHPRNGEFAFGFITGQTLLQVMLLPVQYAIVCKPLQCHSRHVTMYALEVSFTHEGKDTFSQASHSGYMLKLLACHSVLFAAVLHCTSLQYLCNGCHAQQTKNAFAGCTWRPAAFQRIRAHQPHLCWRCLLAWQARHHQGQLVCQGRAR